MHYVGSDDEENEDVEGADSAMEIYNKWAQNWHQELSYEGKHNIYVISKSLF